MKKRILLTTLLTLFALLTFGQIKSHETFRALKAELQLKVLDKKEYQKKLALMIPQNKAFAQSPATKAATKLKLDSMVYHKYNTTTSLWVKNEKDEYTYAANGNYTMGTYYQWNDTTKLWLKDYRDEYSYDANNRWITAVSSDWNKTSNEWVNDFKEEFSYNANGGFSEVIFRDWNDTTKVWVNDLKFNYTYDSNNKNIEFLVSAWNNTTKIWVNSMRFVYTYTTGNLTLVMVDTWNIETSLWVTAMKYEYTYNASNQMLMGIYSLWIEDPGMWLPMTRNEYTYDGNGRTLTDISSSWSPVDTNWVNVTKDVFEYDTNGNNILSTIYKWETGAWVSYSKEETTFDPVNNYSDVIYPTFNYSVTGIPYDSPMLGMYNIALQDLESLWESNAWINNTKTIYYYSSIGTAIAQQKSDKPAEFVIYPNPVFREFSLNTSEENVQISIFDLSGSQVLSKQLSGNESVDVGTLSQGIYMVRITTEKGSVTKKFIKQ